MAYANITKCKRQHSSNIACDTHLPKKYTANRENRNSSA